MSEGAYVEVVFGYKNWWGSIAFEDRFDPQSVVHVAGMDLDYGGAPEIIGRFLSRIEARGATFIVGPIRAARFT